MREWLEKDLNDKDLYVFRKMCRKLERCKQEVGKASEEFADKFERYYKLVAANHRDVEFPEAVRVGMILRKARLTDTQRMLIIRRMSLNEEDKVFMAMRTELQIIMKKKPTP